MTEEDRLRNSPGCGGLIALGLIVIVILALVGLIFPGDILPYPSEIMLGVLVLAVVALVITLLMWRSKRRDKTKDEADATDELLRKGFNTLGDADDEAAKLAQKYHDKEKD